MSERTHYTCQAFVRGTEKSGCYQRIKANEMKPSVGRILHYNVPEIGWRPMMVTSVGGPTRATDGSINPVYVGGWAKLDPDDCGKHQKERMEEYGDAGILVPHEVPVISAFEGEEPGNWRWPPRV